MTDAEQTRGLTELAFAVRRTPDRIRGDLKRSRLAAVKVGRDWRFTREQWEAAVRFYRDQPAPRGAADAVHGS